MPQLLFGQIGRFRFLPLLLTTLEFMSMGSLWAQDRAYVVNAISSSVSVMDTNTHMVVATIPIPNARYPVGIALNPDGTRAYVAHGDPEYITVIDTITNSIASTIRVSPPADYLQGIAVSPDGSRVYVTVNGEYPPYTSGRYVSIINTRTEAVVKHLDLGPVVVGAYGIAFTPDGRKAYVSGQGSDTVSVIDTVSEAVVRTIQVGKSPRGLTVTPNGRRLYVVNSHPDANTISIIDTTTDAVVRTIPAGGMQPNAISISPDGLAGYVASSSPDMPVINLVTNSIVGTVPVGHGATHVAFTPNASHVYVAEGGGATLRRVSVVDTGDNTVIKTVMVEQGPYWIATIKPCPEQVLVSLVRPERGGNTGSVTMTLLGCGFKDDAVVQLVRAGLPAITGSVPQRELGGRRLTTTVDLRGAAPGVRDIVVRNADGTQAIFSNAFTVEQGGAPDIRISKTGTTAVPGRILDYFIVVENVGNVDAESGVISELLDPWFSYRTATPVPSAVRKGRDVFPPASVGSDYIFGLEWQLGTLAPGAIKHLHYQVGLDSQMPMGRTVSGSICLSPVVPNQSCWDRYTSCINETVPSYCKSPWSDPEVVTSDCHFFAGVACQVDWGLCIAGVCRSHIQETVQPVDPNEKLVSHGRFIRPDQTLTFPIHYENIGDVEALDVFVTDILDLNLDTSTLQLLTPGATFDPVTRTVKWNLYGRNLPPHSTDNVLLSIKPKPNLPSGTEIRNKATIQFEIFETITTNETVNTIDTTAPVCKVNPLPSETKGTNILLAWTSTDAIGEVDTQTMFMQVDNGAFTPLLTNTKEKSTTVRGDLGKTYRFYCTAVDSVGNDEIQVPTAEATTTLVSDDPPQTFPGDINGDRLVDCKDIAIVRAAFGKRTGQAGFDARADVVKDNIIDVRDLAFVSQRLPVGTVCQ